MNDHIEIKFAPVNAEQSEILVAVLSETAEGFEEGEGYLKAFVPAGRFNEQDIQMLCEGMRLKYTREIIKETNWNELWESNFPPVIVDDFVSIRAEFHDPIAGMEHDIRITPKMSFGTGHHASTFMMIRQMRDIDFHDKYVFDFGTGTGVLAILAARLGAGAVTAIDNDEWSIDNAAENIARNEVGNIDLFKADSAAVGRRFDIILANINKHIILENMSALAGQLNPGGLLLLSGLLTTDREDIVEAARGFGLVLSATEERHNWLCLRFSH